MGSNLLSFREKEFSAFQKSKANGVIVFGAPWCAACKLVEPILEEIALANKDITIAKIDVSKNPGLASRMGVMSLPNILFIQKGKVADQIIGSTNKSSLEAKIKKMKG